MPPNTQDNATRADASLTGPEKVAVLLLALGKQRAAKVLQRFDAEELKLLAGSAAALKPVTASRLEALVEEFGQNFASGVNFVGTLAEVTELLAGRVGEVSGDASRDQTGQVPVWERVSRIKLDVLRAYLIKEHPQTVAFILSRIESETAAKLISSLPPDQRNGTLSRMVGIKKIADNVVDAVAEVVKEDLLAGASSDAHAGIAEILNRLGREQSEEVLKQLAERRPDDAKALKSMLFSFEDLAGLPAKTRTVLLDQVPIERLVIALSGTGQEFQAAILSSLASRSRRMVEAELQAGSTPAPRDVAAARRDIVQAVLKMAAKGEIELPSPDSVDEITV